MPVPGAMLVGMPSCGRPRWAAPVTHTKRYEAPPICSLTNSKPSAGGGAALPNGRPECAGSTVILPAEKDAPVAANGHAAEIDILLVLYRLATEPGGLPNRHRLFQGR